MLMFLTENLAGWGIILGPWEWTACLYVDVHDAQLIIPVFWGSTCTRGDLWRNCISHFSRIYSSFLFHWWRITLRFVFSVRWHKFPVCCLYPGVFPSVWVFFVPLRLSLYDSVVFVPCFIAVVFISVWLLSPCFMTAALVNGQKQSSCMFPLK